MTQATTYSVPLVGPATPTVMAQRIDDNFDAIISGQSGSSRPSYAVAGMVWQDTSVAGLVKHYHYDGSDDILLFTVDTTNNRVDLPPQAFASVASAATTDIGAVTSKNVTVTGTTTITSFGTAPAGTGRRLVFSGALTLTHNATSLILPQGSNVTTSAGDSLEAVSLGSGNWRVTSYQRTGPALVSGTTTSLSGTSVDFTGIPSWVKQITLVIESLSTNGTAFPTIQIGDSGGVETSGYISTTLACSASNTVVGGASTSGFFLQSILAADAFSGVITLALLDAATNRWNISGILNENGSATLVMVAGTKPLSAAIDRVRFTTSNGTDTFDGGTVNILYQ